MRLSKHSSLFIVLLILDFILLLFTADNFSVSYHEALNYFQGYTWNSNSHIIVNISNFNLLYFLTHLSTSLFGQNDIALRLPFIIFYISSLIVLYLLTKDYFKNDNDRLLSIIIFMLLPGVNSASLLVNEAIIVIFFSLLYLYLFKITKKDNYWLLVLYLFIDNSFAIMYLGLFFYSLKKKDNLLLVVSLILFGVSMQIYGFDTGGRPNGHFLDTFGVYASIFSPIIFLYFFYAMYRITLKGERDLYWHVSFTAFIFSLLLSIRQKILIEDFAPFVVIAIPLMVKLFMHTFRVRIPQFRKKHYAFAIFSLFILFINFMIFIVNKPLYLILENPNKHFVSNYHIVKELSTKLKELKIDKILCANEKLQIRLKYYGISKDNNIYLTEYIHPNARKISITYMGKIIKNYYIITSEENKQLT
jgi:hypothetical protein